MLKMKTLLTAEALGKAGTIYTEGFLFEQCVGDAAVLVVSTAGSITITQQCSFDNVHFYTPVDHSATALGNICTTMTVTTGTYIAFDPVLAKFIRFAITETDVAATAVSLLVAFSREVNG